MAFRDLYRFDDLRNIAEDLVIEEIGRQLGDSAREDFSEDTILDIAACALNMLKPMYRVNLLGRMYADAFKQEYHDEITETVRKAIDRVITNP